MVCTFQQDAEGSWGGVNSSEGPAHGCGWTMLWQGHGSKETLNNKLC